MKNARLLRCVALLIVLTMLLSAATFASGSNYMEKLEQRIAAVPAADESTVWSRYSDALAKQGAGDCDGAVTSYAAALNHFADNDGEEDNGINEINAYRQIAECYAAIGEHEMAEAAYRTAAQKTDEYIRANPDKADMLQEQISYERSADALKSVTELYVRTYDPSQGSGTYFGVSGEPENGIVIGAYAELDENVHDTYGTMRYWDNYSDVTGVETGVYMLYMDYGSSLTRIEEHVEAARENGFAIELSLQPRGGLDAVHEDDLALAKLARDIEESGVQFYIRFAAEMNDASGGNNWYTEDTEEYIRAFRAVANVFHRYAPSAAMVWAPNYYPTYNIEDYYPGDAYVDMVGVSLYMNYRPELNPLGTGEENRRWIDELETIYSLYGDRMPIMITEGAVCLSTTDGTDLSDFAAEQLRELFLYLPIRFPNVKFMVWFDSESVVGNEVYSCITSNPTVMNAYRQVLQGNESVLPSVDAPAAPVYYGRLTSGSVVEGGMVTLCSYAKGAAPIASVRYSVNGVTLGTSRTAPYALDADFSAWSGENVVVTVSTYYANGTQAGGEAFALRVADTASERPVADAAELLGEDTASALPAADAATETAPAAAAATEGTAFARSLEAELGDGTVTLSTYAILDENGYETNYVGLRDLAAILNGTTKQYNVDWDGTAINVKTGSAYVSPAERAVGITGDHAFRVNTALTRIDGAAASLTGIVLNDENGGGYVFYKLRDLGDALGFNVGWSLERGIYLEL